MGGGVAFSAIAASGAVAVPSTLLFIVADNIFEAVVIVWVAIVKGVGDAVTAGRGTS